MKKNCIVIPLDIPAKFSPGYSGCSSKTSTNRLVSNHISYDISSIIKEKNEQNTFQKYSNKINLIKSRELHSSKNAQYFLNDYYIN